MDRVVATGVQDYAELIEKNRFYVDKTEFIREWWNNADEVTLITRPRRFGKTLNLSMMKYFFSNQYAGRSDLFERQKVWRDQNIRPLRAQYPVIFLTFAGVKATSFESNFYQIRKQIVNVFSDLKMFEKADHFDSAQKAALSVVSEKMSMDETAYSLQLLSRLMEAYYGQRVLIFLDEYDTPLQEAYAGGYWEEEVGFLRTLFNNTFKTNPSMERALMTGITRVSKESIFSDLNNLEVVTTSSEKYETCFGFTEDEVFQAMDQQGFSDGDKQGVKRWYDGFTFGQVTDIYNPWSVASFLDKREYAPYWANTSENKLVSILLQQSSSHVKTAFEDLLAGGTVVAPIDEQIVFNQLKRRKDAIWSLLLASGYLKIVHREKYQADQTGGAPQYTLELTNLEVRIMFQNMITGWFDDSESLSPFVRALLRGDEKSMNRYMNEIALSSMSSFDAGAKSSRRQPERFYHGLVLGMLVDQAENYALKSNRESGYGRYDVVMEPKREELPAVIMEFKVYDREDAEAGLEDTAAHALKQIEEMKYDTDLLARGIPADRIYKYGFAFRGKKCLIRRGKQ